MSNFAWSWGALVALPSLKVACCYALGVNLGAIAWKKSGLDLSEPLRYPLVLFNLAISIANLVCFGYFVIGIYELGIDKIYQDESNPSLHMAFDIFYWLKVIELLDTLFIVLRRRFRQLSFLHIYHHASILILAEAGTVTYSAPVSIGCSLNCFVHIVMYFYWSIVAAGKDMSNYKKMVTQIQLLQFVLGGILLTHGYMRGGFCIYAPLYDVSMILLFSDFYYKSYVRGGAKKHQKAQ